MVKKRLALPDILKGIAVVRMVLVHLFEVFASPEISSHPLNNLLLFLAGPPGAALFMVIMGYFLAQSTKSLGESVLRGLKLIVWGLLLNIGMNLHLLILVVTTKVEVNPWPFVFGVDILFLAGLGMILISLLKRLLKNKWSHWAVLFLVVSAVGNYIPECDFQLTCLVYVRAFFAGNAAWSYFPLFPWMAYPVAGFIFYLLDKQYNISTFTTKGLVYIALALVIPLVATFRQGFAVVMDQSAYYHHSTMFSIWLLAMLALWVIVIRLISKKRENNFLFSWFQWVGQRVTNFYVIQWLLIGNIGTWLYQSQGGWSLLLWFAVFLLLTNLGVIAWQFLKRGLTRLFL
jgi:peptidoglycan/LPS O-acetylase OafA/YrhL